MLMVDSNLDDGVLHEGLCTHQLVVGGIVHDIEHTGLAGAHCTSRTGGHEMGDTDGVVA